MKEETFPIRVKRGNVELFIHRYEKKKSLTDGRAEVYLEFRFNYYENGTRKMKASSDLTKIKRKAEFIASKLAAGQPDLLKLSAEDGVVFLKMREAEKRLGISMIVAIAEYEEARKIAPSQPLTEIARWYDRHHKSVITRKTVTEVKNEFVESKRADGLSDSYVEDLESRCGRFADSFQCPITDICATDVKEFLRDLDLSGRSQNNYRTALNTLFEFAKAHSYVPRDCDVMELVAKTGVARNDIVDINETSIFTPEEFSKLLKVAPKQILPAYVIGAFTGMRQSEIMRLDWNDLKLDRKFISVWGTIARKKRETRRPPILPNLEAWLEPFAKHTGKVWPLTKAYFYELNADVCSEAKIKWRDNVLRHSYISYRVAQIRNKEQTAEEAGTSVAKIRSNYLELVDTTEAEKWFLIVPGRHSSS